MMRGLSRGVAQPGSAPQWGCGGRRFKSSRPDHQTTKPPFGGFFVCCYRAGFEPEKEIHKIAGSDFERALHSKASPQCESQGRDE